MKDLTHYFQFPTKEREDERQKESGTITGYGDRGEAEADSNKICKKPTKVDQEVAKNAPLFASDLEFDKSETSNPSKVKCSTEKIKYNHNKINYEVTKFTTSRKEIMKPIEHNISEEEKCVSFSVKGPIEISGIKYNNETSSSQISHAENQRTKKKLSLSLQKPNSHTADEVRFVDSIKSKASDETCTKELSEKKRHSLSQMQGSKTDDSVVKLYSLDNIEGKSVKDKERSRKKRKLSLLPQRCNNFADKRKSTYSEGSETDTANEICINNSSKRMSPTLSENTNAFHVLMSSRTWSSPHGHIAVEKEDGNLSTSPDKKKIRTIVADTSMEEARIKENRKRRKKKLEDMVERKRIKKAKDNYTSSEVKMEEKLFNNSSRILIVSDSDDDSYIFLQKTDVLKAKDVDKQASKVSCEVVGGETEDGSTKPGNEKTCIKKENKEGNKKQLSTVKYPTRISPRKIVKIGSKPVQSNVKCKVEEMKNNSLEPEEKRLVTKKPAVKLQNISSREVSQICAQELEKDIAKAICKGQWKLVSENEDEELHERFDSMEDSKKEGQMKRNKMASCKVSKYKVKNTSSQKLCKLTKKNYQRDKSYFKGCSQQEVEPLQEYNDLNTARDEKDSKTRKLSVKESNHKEETPSKEQDINEAALENIASSETNLPTTSEECYKSPNGIDEAKKRNSLFSYFNKVSKDEVQHKSETIQVKVQIHSPPKSPSVKKRYCNVSKSKVEERRVIHSKILDKEDQIVVLESHLNSENECDTNMITTPEKNKIPSCLRTSSSSQRWKMRVKLRESSVEIISNGNAGWDNDEHIFTPKKKWTHTTSVQQKAAMEVLRKAKTKVKYMTVKQMNSPESSTSNAEIKEEEVIVCSNIDKKSNVPVKLAPLFVRAKAISKQKVDPALIEARQNFLKSGVPEPLKKLVDLQRSLEELYHFTFPSVAHVQQRDDQSYIWNLPLVKPPICSSKTKSSAFLITKQIDIKIGSFIDCSRTDKDSTLWLQRAKPSVPTPITCFRKLLHLLKLESPSYPIYRNFKQLYSKYNNLQDVEKCTEEVLEERQKKRNNRKSRMTRSNTKTEEQRKKSSNVNAHIMWTEKYKPTTVDDIVGNGHSVAQLKKWLETWKRYSVEIQSRDKENRKRKDSSSGDEFTDSDSNDSHNGNLPNNTAILVGPYGCGKTSAVYAIANELGCKVLEINASSKRNGKRVLSELQEATQSHQLQAGAEHIPNGLGSFLKRKPTKSKKSKTSRGTPKPKHKDDDHNSSKMSLILVEEVDVIYEDQDEGFVSALNSLVASSKRPVIFITNDPHCPHLARFMDVHLVLKFSAPSSRAMSSWLQLICLLEGVRVRCTEIETLLDLNGSDMRKSLLQLQFWVLSGGSNTSNTVESCEYTQPEKPSPQISAVEVVEEHSNLSWICDGESEETLVTEHSNCIEPFIEYTENNFESRRILFPLDLGYMWWNLASLLSISENFHQGKIGIQSLSINEEVVAEAYEVQDRDKSDSNDTEFVVKERESDSVVLNEVPEATCSDESKKGINLSKDFEKKIVEKEMLSHIGKGNNEQLEVGNTDNDSETKDHTISEYPENQSVVKKCSQLEAECIARFMERLSALDVLSCCGNIGKVGGREPCITSWDQVPKDGTSLIEDAHYQWKENPVSRFLCHCLLESSVDECRTCLQERQGNQLDKQVDRVLFTRPTQQEKRWRMKQHAADNVILSAVPLWYRPDHHSVAVDYNSMLRAVCRCEQGRLLSNTKRRNRFFHYLKGLHVHANDETLKTICAVFANRCAT